jgi:protein-disulfide isomerase
VKPLIFALAAVAALAQDRLVEGNPKSSVRVIAYEDLQCPDCAVYRKMMDDKLLPKYGGKVAFEHRDFPLKKHAWARRASLAARYFDSIDATLGIEFRQWTMATQRNITPENFDAELTRWTTEHKQDPARVKAALSDARFAKLVDEDYEEGIARGVARTPTVFVNGEPFIETFTFEEISNGIDTAIAATGK